MFPSLKSLEEKEIKLEGSLLRTAEGRGSLRKPRPERKGIVVLVIKIRDEVITFNPVGEWVSSDKVLADALNVMIPEDYGNPAIVFSEGGNEGLVLDHLQLIWPELKVVVFEPEPPPPERPGILYSCNEEG